MNPLHTLITDVETAGPIAVGADPRFVPQAVLSIGEPGSKPAWFDEVTVPKLRREFDDVTRYSPIYQMPTQEDVSVIVRFLNETKDVPILIHCAAGISRSSACAYLRFLLRGRGSTGDEMSSQVKSAIAQGLRAPIPVRPNPLIVRLGVLSFPPALRPRLARAVQRDLGFNPLQEI